MSCLQLGEHKARNLDEASNRILPGIFQALAGYDRPVLMECGDHSRSSLAQKICELTKNPEAVVSCGRWNGCDLGTSEGLKLQLSRIRLERPQHVWISPNCKGYCPYQNMNMRDAEQKAQVLKQREEDLKTLIGVSCVVAMCAQNGIHVTVELAERSQAWRLPVSQQFTSKYNMHSAVTKGCAVNLRDIHNHKLVQKGWRLVTTSKRLAQVMSLTCKCDRQYKHGNCQGKNLVGSGKYTTEYVTRAARALTQELSHQGTLQECAGMSQLLEGFGEGEFCTCEEASGMKFPVACASCLRGREEVLPGLERDQVTEVQGLECLGNDEEDPGEALVCTSETTQSLESQAQKYMNNQDYSHQTCEQLLKQLPFKTSKQHRGPLKEQKPRYIAFGLYSHGNHYGLTKQSQVFPQVCRYVVQYLKHWSPETVYCTSFVVNDNCHLELHKDVHNVPGTPNYLIGLGSYQGGELWIENSEDSKLVGAPGKRLLKGHWLQGIKVDAFQRVVKF